MAKPASAMRSKINKEASQGTAKTAKANGSARKQNRGNSEGLNQRQILAALRALKRGDFKVRLPDDCGGVDGEIASVFNELASGVAGFGDDLGRLRAAVGKEGRTDQRLQNAAIAGGGWSEYVTHVNEMLNDVTAHTDEVARV